MKERSISKVKRVNRGIKEIDGKKFYGYNGFVANWKDLLV